MRASKADGVFGRQDSSLSLMGDAIARSDRAYL